LYHTNTLALPYYEQTLDFELNYNQCFYVIKDKDEIKQHIASKLLFLYNS